MPKRHTGPVPERSGEGIQFNHDETEALKLLVGYVLEYDAVRPPYSEAVQCVLLKLGLLKEDSPEIRGTALPRSPVKMQ